MGLNKPMFLEYHFPTDWIAGDATIRSAIDCRLAVLLRPEFVSTRVY